MKFQRWYIMTLLVLMQQYVFAQQDSLLANKTAGWMPARDHDKFIPYFSYYTANSFRDIHSRYKPYADKGRFVSKSLRLYNEYGLDEGLALVATLPVVLNTYTDTGQHQQNFNLSDLEVGVRKYLHTFDTTFHLMGQLSGIFPFYSIDHAPATGLQKFGVEAKIIFGGSIKRYHYKPFLKAEAAFRQFVNGPPQVLYQALGGYNITARDQVSFEFSGTASYGTSNLFDQGNVAINQRYAFHKFTFNYGHKLGDHVALYAGFFHDFSNWNTGIGKGGQVFLVITI